jgi:hypothetical protein
MYGNPIHSTWDLISLAIPFLGVMFVGLLRIDEVVVSRRPRRMGANRRQAVVAVDKTGKPIVCLPGGRQS